MNHAAPIDPYGIDPQASYEAEEVALLLFRTTLRTFNRHRRQRAREGFPKPISRWGKKVWSGQSLLDWRDRQTSASGHSEGVIDFSAVLAANARQLGSHRR